MRKRLCLNLILGFIVCTIAAGQAEQQDQKPNPPAKFERGVVVDDCLIAVDNRGHLVSSNLTWGGGRDYGKLDRELGPYIDVANDKACVATKEEICEIDLASGKIVRSAKNSIGIGGVGFIGADRVFIHNGLSLEILDLTTGRALHKIELCEGKLADNWVSGGKPVIAHSRRGDLLYVGGPYRGPVALVDLNKGQVVRKIKADRFGWTTGVHVAGNSLVTRQLMISYGFVLEQLSMIDLETGNGKSLPFPSGPGENDPLLGESGARNIPLEILAARDGGFYLAAHEGVYRYNVNGQIVGASPQALTGGKRLVGELDGSALVADATSVRQVEMSPVSSTTK